MIGVCVQQFFVYKPYCGLRGQYCICRMVVVLFLIRWYWLALVVLVFMGRRGLYLHRSSLHDNGSRAFIQLQPQLIHCWVPANGDCPLPFYTPN